MRSRARTLRAITMPMTASIRLFGFLVLATPALACSSGSSPAPALDSSAKLNALSTGGLQALCDWTNAQEGGYGAVIPCDAGASSIEADSNQAACVAESMQHFDKVSCPGTVGDWMMCVEWRLSNWCSANPPAPTGQCEALQNGCFGSGYPEDAGTDQ